MIQHAVAIIGITLFVIIAERLVKRSYPSYEVRSVGRIFIDTAIVYALAIFVQTSSSNALESSSAVFTGDPPF
jgi:hypothetical protein